MATYIVRTGKGDFRIRDQFGEIADCRFLKEKAEVVADRIARKLGSSAGRVSGAGSDITLIYGRPGDFGLSVRGQTIIYAVEPA